MARGNWKAAAYIDDRASHAAYEALINIFSGKAKGTTGLFKVLVSEFLGAERAPVEFTTEGNARRLMVGKKSKVRSYRLLVMVVRISSLQILNIGWVQI